MPTYRQEMPDNVRYLQQQIHRQGTAPLGPVSIGPGQGHVRLYTETGDTARLDPSGMSIKYRGSLRGLTPLTESFANSIEAHTNLLSTHDRRLDGHDADVTRIDAKNAAQDDSLSKKAWTTYVDQQDSALGGRVDGVVDTLGRKAWTSYVDSQDSALSGRISTAQSRADSAHSLAASKANVSYVDTKASRSELEALRNEVKYWVAIARQGIPGLPPWPGA